MTEVTYQGSSTPNAQQREKWNNETGSRWLDRHATVDQQIAPFGHRAMDRAGIRLGQQILDVGCGCGETTLELAHRVGPAGAVTGLDISARLVEAARKLARRSGLSNVSFEEGDAQTYPFPATSFDVVFSRFGIMFFDDPDAAFHNLRVSLRPGGCLAFVCWPAPRENQFVTIPLAAAARHVSLPTPTESSAPSPFAFADTDRLRGILSRSGFTEIEVERAAETIGGKSLDETTDMLLQLGPLDEILDSLDGETRRAIRTDIRAALSQFETSGRFWLDAAAWLVAAHA